MQVLSVDDIQRLDCWAIEDMGISRQILMENAGKSVADLVLTRLKGARSAAILIYKGNNGGDGLAAARYLNNAGLNTKVYCFCPLSELKNEPLVNLQILKKLKVQLEEINSPEAFNRFNKEIKGFEVIVDALFGIGLKGKIMGFPAKAIDLINQTIDNIIAVDVPSGVNADTGEVDPHAVRAAYTITFSRAKKGFFRHPASEYIGRLIVADIGIPDKEISSKPSAQTTSPDILKDLFKLRKADSHKGDFGRAMIFAGSKNMAGAAILAARAAICSGAGLVYLALPESLQQTVAPAIPEIITIGLPETKAGAFAKTGLKPALELCEKADCVAIGPGISTDPETMGFVRDLLLSLSKRKANVILDADALAALILYKKQLKGHKLNLVITPHPGEAASMLNVKTSAVQKDREKAAQKLAKTFKAIAVLKGANTVVVDQKGNKYINVSGNPGMATAGAGDVLTGIMVGLLAQDLPIFQSAAASVYIHGKAGDIAAEEKGEQGVISSDIVENIPPAIKGN